MPSLHKLHFTKFFTSLHFTSLHFTSLHFTSLHFTSLHFTLKFHFTHLEVPLHHTPYGKFVELQFTTPKRGSYHRRLRWVQPEAQVKCIWEHFAGIKKANFTISCDIFLRL